MTTPVHSTATKTALPSALVAAVEHWTPDPRGSGLACETMIPSWTSDHASIPGGQELAEAAAASGRPSIISLSESASDAIKAAIVIPQFDLEGQLSVLILYLRGGEQVSAAAELWRGRSGSFELSLGEGYHPGLERFARVSQFVCFPRGAGLPGAIWESGLPRLIPDIGTAKGFLRSSGAGEGGLTTGLGLPVIQSAELKAVILLLSSAASPIIHRQSIWLAAAKASDDANDDASTLVCSESACSIEAQAGSAHLDDTHVIDDDSMVSQAWSSGRVVMKNLAEDPAGLSCGLAIPVVLNGRVRATTLMHW